jgi:hypothetical protein
VAIGLVPLHCDRDSETITRQTGRRTLTLTEGFRR